MQRSMISTFLIVTSTCVSALSIPRHSADTSGCGQKHPVGFHDADQSQSIKSGDYIREYGVYVPHSYNNDPHKKRKVIIDYHGNNGTPVGQYNNSMYYKYSEGEEYLAIYPAGVNQSWQSAPYSKGVDDLQFTTDLLAHLRQTYCIDSDHIYASGKSNGGGFVDFLACSDNGDEFAAFAMASAALYSDNSLDTCNKKRAILESHGGNDTTISYTGGPRNNGTLPDVREWIGWWAERDGCAASDQGTTEKYPGYETISYSCKGQHDVVQHYKIYDLGHCWPSGTGDNSDGTRDYCYDHSLDYTPVVLDFFNKWDLANAPSNEDGWTSWHQ